jgi:hypothetical protein
MIDDDESGTSAGMRIGWGTKYSEKTCPSATLSITNSTWLHSVSNEAAAVGSQRLTNCLGYGTAQHVIYTELKSDSPKISM